MIFLKRNFCESYYRVSPKKSSHFLCLGIFYNIERHPVKILLMTYNMQMTIISSFFVSQTTTKLLETRSLTIQQRLVRSTEPDKQTQERDDDGQGDPECHLVLDHHVSGHGGTASWLQVLGATLLIWLAGEYIVRIIQTYKH